MNERMIFFINKTKMTSFETYPWHADTDKMIYSKYGNKISLM